MIYFNNAATSFPKPAGTAEAMAAGLSSAPSNPYRENAAAESCADVCRRRIARLFGFDEPNRVVFCSGSTEALNMAIFGLAPKRGRILTTEMEHNAVLRPLHYLRSRGGAKTDYTPCGPRGEVSLKAFEKALGKETRLAVVNHASNVTGAQAELSEIYAICESREIPLIVDASQSAGALDFDLSSMPLAATAFTGHKSLLGPKGVGGLLIGEGLEPEVWKSGGTGIRSDRESMPELWPAKYEAGTMNEPGIAGLAFSVGTVLDAGVSAIRDKKAALTAHLVEALRKLGGAKVYSEVPEKNRCGIVCFNINGWSPADVGYVLGHSFDIRVRTGLHCAPLVHRRMGTFPEGAVRVGFSAFNEHEEVEILLDALAGIAKK